MSLIPLLYRDWLDEFDRSSRLFNHNLGSGLRRDDLFDPSWATGLSQRGSFLRPWRLLGRQNSANSVSTVQDNDNKFQVALDVSQFAPEEITVKTSDRTVIVEGKHEEKADEHGYISRHFVRKYLLPSESQLDQVTSTLSSDGVLTIIAPKKVAIAAGERVVPITPIGPARPPPTVTSPLPQTAASEEPQSIQVPVSVE